MSALLTRLACLIRAEKHEERSDRLVFAINEIFSNDTNQRYYFLLRTRATTYTTIRPGGRQIRVI